MEIEINKRIIKQEKSDEVLILRGDAIVELLKDCNIAEKYKVLHSLIVGLQNIIFENKGAIIIGDKKLVGG